MILPVNKSYPLKTGFLKKEAKIMEKGEMLV
jgi:hypothetical protein